MLVMRTMYRYRVAENIAKPAASMWITVKVKKMKWEDELKKVNNKLMKCIIGIKQPDYSDISYAFSSDSYVLTLQVIKSDVWVFKQIKVRMDDSKKRRCFLI